MFSKLDFLKWLLGKFSNKFLDDDWVYLIEQILKNKFYVYEKKISKWCDS